MINFAGQWFTTFGPMTLKQNRANVSGTYQMGQANCTIEGQVKKDRLQFSYREPNAEGEGWFELVRAGKFTGRWRVNGSSDWAEWTGVRGFEGIWQSSFGPMRLFQDGDNVHGFYECGGNATITGEVTKDRLDFKYHEPKVQGTGWFQLDKEGQQFFGKWQADGTREWRDWQGKRIQPTLGLKWLVVLEAHWQAHLQENEYAFGHMLREFFARVPTVKVRQRFFTNAEGLQKWCQELMYLAEPVVLVIASHGTAEGLQAHGQVIDGVALAEGLRHADEVRLLHFSSCLMMEKGTSSTWFQKLKARFPISGYTTSVDWAASAITEFLYLDMILSKGLPPEQAAAQIPKLLAFAGDQVDSSSPYPAAGFRFLVGNQNQKLEKP